MGWNPGWITYMLCPLAKLLHLQSLYIPTCGMGLIIGPVPRVPRVK